MLDDNQIELELEYCCDIRKCKLTKIPIYITVNYIKGCTYEEGFENKYRPNIEKIVLNGVEKNKDDPLDINMGSEILIYFTEPPTNIDNFFSSVYDKNVDKIGSIDFSHFNSSIITSMAYLFKGCTSLQSLDLSGFTISTETNIENMISDCSSLIAIDIPNIDLTNEGKNQMFNNNGELLYVNLLNCKGETDGIYDFLNPLLGFNNNKKFICINKDTFDAVGEKYPKSSGNWEDIAEKCCNFDIENLECGYLLVNFNSETDYDKFDNGYRSNIEKIIIGDVEKTKDEGINIPKDSKIKIYFSSPLTDLGNFFSFEEDKKVANINSIDFSHLDLSKVEDMTQLFFGCSSLESITFSKYAPKNIKYIEGMFSSCMNIKSIDLSNFKLSSDAKITGLFYFCESLIAVDLPNIDLTKYSFSDLFEFFGDGKLKYINMYHCTGLSQMDIATFVFSFLQLVVSQENSFICMNDQDFSEIIQFFEDMGASETVKNLEKCCDFNINDLECVLPPTNIPFTTQEIESTFIASTSFIDSIKTEILFKSTEPLSTSIPDNIEPMSTSEFYINEPQTSFADYIEPKSSSGLFNDKKYNQ